MKIEFQLCLQKIIYLRNRSQKIILIFMDKHKIVRIAQIIPHLQFFFYESIKFVQIDIGEQLGNQIADWQSPNAPPPREIWPLVKLSIIAPSNPKVLTSVTLLLTNFFNNS